MQSKSTLRAVMSLSVIATGLIGGYVVYAQAMKARELPDGLIQANGRIEGDHVTIASKFAGRIVELKAREGDDVAAEQVLICLDDKQVRAKVDQAKQAAVACDARIKAADAELLAADARIKAAKTALEVTRKQVPLAVATAEAELAHANALAASADSTEGQKRSEYERWDKLRQSVAVSEEEADKKRLAWTVARNELTTAQSAVVAAEKKLADAKLGDDRIRAKEDDLNALKAERQRIVAGRAECVAAKAEAEAALVEAQSVLDDLAIVAPSAGILTTRIADKGEVVAAGAPLFDLVNLDQLYLKVYVPESEIGKVRLGLKAKIYTDAFPDQPFDATVRYIASRAEFTPKEVQTPDERVKLVYAVKLYLDDNPDHRLTPGLPADAVIRWKEDAAWAKPRW